jgi:phage-related protein
MNWHVTFYNEKVEKKTLSFPKGILANFLHIVEMIEEYGPSLGKPYTAPMGDGLFEIRAKGKEGIGVLYFVQSKAMRSSFSIHLLKNLRKYPRKR